MSFFKNPRGLITAAVSGVLVVGAVALGVVYFLVFAGSSPQKLSLSSATVSPATSASTSSARPGAGTWTITSGSQAGYRVREQLAVLASPSDAVGRTSSVHGTVTITVSGSTYAVAAASIRVDVNTLTSDRAIRDQRIHTMGLESDQYPTATFVLGTPIALPASAGNGQTFQAAATGVLTVHGVARTVTIPIQARLNGSQIELAGSITFSFNEFGMTPPSIGGFVSVQDNATMEFALVLVQQGA